MKKIKSIMLVALLSATFSISAFAGTERSDWRTINSITVGSTGHLYVYGAGAEINPAFCTGLTSRYALPTDHPAYNRLYALILSGWLSDFEFRATVLDDSCTAGSPEATLFNMRPAQ